MSQNRSSQALEASVPTTRIHIYAPDEISAARLAAKMNLALRHWQWVGAHHLGTWADVGKVMDDIQEQEFQKAKNEMALQISNSRDLDDEEQQHLKNMRRIQKHLDKKL